MELNAYFFINNRKRLKQAFTGTAPIVITANCYMQKSADIAFSFFQDSNFWYLTGVDEPGYVLVMDNDSEYLISPKVNESHAIFNGLVNLEAIVNISGIYNILDNDEGWKKLSRKLNKVKHVATISPPASYIDHYMMCTSSARSRLVEKIKSLNSSIDYIDLKKTLASLRMQKSDQELDQIRLAIRNTALLYKNLQKSWVKSNSENDVMADALKYITKNNLDFSYQPIIASGVNATTINYQKNNSEFMDPNDLLLIDMAVSNNKYCSDITRSVSKNPTKRQRMVYDAVISVFDFAVSRLGPGILLSEYEKEVRSFMGEKLRELGLIKIIEHGAIDKYFPHSTSHFLGIDVHDAGDSAIELNSGVVLTVEPGIYIPEEKIGIRIEDVLCITDKGVDNLSEPYIIKDIAKLA